MWDDVDFVRTGFTESKHQTQTQETFAKENLKTLEKECQKLGKRGRREIILVGESDFLMVAIILRSKWLSI